MNSEIFVVYAHRSLKYGLFYIGMGSENRAFSKRNRNSDWKRIASLSDYEILLMGTNLTREEACQLEMDCISFAGLDNLTNRSKGGEHAAFGMRHTEDAKKTN